MTSTARSFANCHRRCQQLGIPLSRQVFVVNVASQSAVIFQRFPEGAGFDECEVLYDPVKVLRCSTSRFGVGQANGSKCTPLGLHRIAEKIGGGWPAGAAFESREFVGYTWQGRPGAKITTRILWLEGLEPGFNHGGKVDSHARHIYIHGTGDETTLGRPASSGCIQLAANDLIPLFDRLPSGTLVWIEG